MLHHGGTARSEQLAKRSASVSAIFHRPSGLSRPLAPFLNSTATTSTSSSSADTPPARSLNDVESRKDVSHKRDDDERTARSHLDHLAIRDLVVSKRLPLHDGPVRM